MLRNFYKNKKLWEKPEPCEKSHEWIFSICHQTFDAKKKSGTKSGNQKNLPPDDWRYIALQVRNIYIPAQKIEQNGLSNIWPQEKRYSLDPKMNKTTTNF